MTRSPTSLGRGGLLGVAGGERLDLVSLGQERQGDPRAGQMPGVHGAQAVVPRQGEGVMLDLVLRHGDDRDPSVVAQRRECRIKQCCSRRAAIGVGSGKRRHDLDPRPRPGHEHDSAVIQELPSLVVAILVGEEGANQNGGVHVDDHALRRPSSMIESMTLPSPRMESMACWRWTAVVAPAR